MTHTKSAGGVILDPENLVLVVNQDNRSWSFPKGQIEDGENARQAAEREISEETGLRNLQYICDLGSYNRLRIGKNEPEDKTSMKNIELFLYRTKNPLFEPEDPRHTEAKWLPFGEVVQQLTHQKDKDFFEEVLPTIREHIAS